MRRHWVGHGQSVFPSPSARPRGEQLGFTPFVYCQQCGLPNDTRKTSWSETGDGFGAVFDVTVTAVEGQSQANTKDANVQGGCRFCGSLFWRDSKPQRWPDGNDAPSDDWLMSRRKKRRR